MNANRNPAPYYAPPGQFQRGPIVKPIDSCWRGYYETGKDGNFNTPTLPTVAFEAVSLVSRQPCWLMYAHACFTTVQVARFVLFFDLNPSDPTQLALVQAGAIARHTFGPMVPGSAGTIVYESSAELVPVPFQGAPQDGPEKPWAYGLPFNFGIIAAASSTPRVLTPVQQQPACMALVCRMQT